MIHLPKNIQTILSTRLLLTSRTSAAVCQPRFKATPSAVRCARRWILWSFVRASVSVNPAHGGKKMGHTFLVKPHRRLAVGNIGHAGYGAPFLSLVSTASNSRTKSFLRLRQSSGMKSLVYSAARLVSIRITFFRIMALFIVACFIAFQMPSASRSGNRFG